MLCGWTLTEDTVIVVTGSRAPAEVEQRRDRRHFPALVRDFVC